MKKRTASKKNTRTAKAAPKAKASPRKGRIAKPVKAAAKKSTARRSTAGTTLTVPSAIVAGLKEQAKNTKGGSWKSLGKKALKAAASGK